jgi:hypothetical protein
LSHPAPHPAPAVKTYSRYGSATPYQTDAASQFDIPLDFNDRLGAAVRGPLTPIPAAAAFAGYRAPRCRRAS